MHYYSIVWKSQPSCLIRRSPALYRLSRRLIFRNDIDMHKRFVCAEQEMRVRKKDRPARGQ
jgi:hypothetical protein